MIHLEIIDDWRLSKVEQIVLSIEQAIRNNELIDNSQLPSINEFSAHYNVARDTIEKAYKLLKIKGYVTSIQGRGYYVSLRKDQPLNVLLVLNKLSGFKKVVYNSFVGAFKDKAKVDLAIHHYDLNVLRDIIKFNAGRYDYYVIMPHFFYHTPFQEVLDLLAQIPPDKLVLLDKRVRGLSGSVAQVYQDFEADIFDALLSAKELFSRYTKIVVCLQEKEHHPKEILTGVRKFCRLLKISYAGVSTVENIPLEPGTLYVEASESDLAALLKEIRQYKMKLGQDIGILSFNETALKEVLNVTVVTTDFEAMGLAAAQLILKREVAEIRNPFYLIKRKSV